MMVEYSYSFDKVSDRLRRNSHKEDYNRSISRLQLHFVLNLVWYLDENVFPNVKTYLIQLHFLPVPANIWFLRELNVFFEM